MTSFYPDSDTRYEYAAIRAFNVELSNVAESVKSTQIGRLRFQWWREAIASLNTVRETLEFECISQKLAAGQSKV